MYNLSLPERAAFTDQNNNATAENFNQKATSNYCYSDIEDLKFTAKVLKSVDFFTNSTIKSFDRNVFKPHFFQDLPFVNVNCRAEIFSTEDKTLVNHSIIRLVVNQKPLVMTLANNRFISNMNQKKTKNFSFEKLAELLKNEHANYSNISKSQFQIKDLLRKNENSQILIKKQFLNSKACQKADKLALKFLDKTWNLTQEMNDTGLKSDDIDLIKKHSKGTYLLPEFLQNIKVAQNATVIGLNHKSIIDGLTPNLECEDYMDAYKRIFNDFKRNPDFLNKLTAEKHEIVFVVPHKLFGDKEGVTGEEMRWLLDNPDAMENVHFVFSAYKTYSNKEINLIELNDYDFLNNNGIVTKNHATEWYTEYLVDRLFKQIQAKNFLPKVEVNLNLNQDLIRLTEKVDALKNCLVNKSVKADLKQITSGVSETIKKEAIFLMGAAGSGKGTVRDLIIESNSDKKYLIIDPDLIKDSMPEYLIAQANGQSNAATLLHKKSVEKANKLYKKTLNQDVNVIYDSTGSRKWDYKENMDAAKNKGMSVELIYVKADVETCKLRVNDRAQKTGRFVPNTTVEDTHFYAQEHFNKLSKRADGVKIYDNNGAKPILS